MTAIAQRRVAGATALMILLYLLQAALFAPPAQAAEPLGGLIQNTFVNYSPNDGGWTPGQNPQYVEGDVIPLSFSVVGASTTTTYEFTACFDYYYGSAAAFAFIDLDDYNASYTVPPRGGDVIYSKDGAASDGAEILSVERLGTVNHELCGGTSGRQSIGFQITIKPTLTDFYMYFGGKTARAGFTTDLGTPVVNGVISWPTGTFQAYLAQTTGNKTVNFKPNSFVPFGTNVSVVVGSCEYIEGASAEAVITIATGATVRITGPGGYDETFTETETIDLPPGTYNWVATPINDSYVIDGDREGSFTIIDCSPGSASVTVVKAVTGVPGDDPLTHFDFEITDPEDLDSDESFDLEDGQDETFDYEIPFESEGVNVTVSEDDSEFSANWKLTSIECKDDEDETVGTVDGDSVDLTLNDGDEITCTFTNTFTPDGSASVIVRKQVNTGAPAATFGFSITDKDNFQLAGGGQETFQYVIPVDSTGEDVTVSEITSALQARWAFTSVSCEMNERETGVVTGSSVTVTLDKLDTVTCTFVNTYTPPPPPVVTTTTTTAPPEVAGTTVTTAPEVVAETLPFTGFETGDTLKLGLLAMLAGVLMLFAVRGPRREEETGDDVGGWSVL